MNIMRDQRAAVVARVNRMGALLVPSASKRPRTIRIAFVFINICVPGAMVTVAPFVTTTVPESQLVPDQVVSLLTVPEMKLVTACAPLAKIKVMSEQKQKT
jgi:hypothetical protein